MNEMVNLQPHSEVVEMPDFEARPLQLVHAEPSLLPPIGVDSRNQSQMRSNIQSNLPMNIESIMNQQNDAVQQLGYFNTDNTDAMMINFSANSIPPVINVPTISDSHLEKLKKCTVNSKILASISEAIADNQA